MMLQRRKPPVDGTKARSQGTHNSVCVWPTQIAEKPHTILIWKAVRFPIFLLFAEEPPFGEVVVVKVRSKPAFMQA